MAMSNFTSNPPAGNNGAGGSNPPGGGNPPAGGMPNPPMRQSMPGASDDAMQYLIDYNAKFANAEATMFRDLTIRQLMAVLIGKTKPNALLVGPAGTGKTRLVEDVARRIALGDASVPSTLKNHTVYELSMTNLIAGAGIVGELEERVKTVVEFAANPRNKAVLFVDEIHQLADGHASGPYSKVAQILKPALARGDLHMIGATTTTEARQLDTDPALKRRFSRLTVDELTPEQTVVVLQKASAGYMAHYAYQVTVSDEVLSAIVDIADENNAANSHRPDNALTLLDRAMATRLVEHSSAIATAQATGDTLTLNALQAMPTIPLTEAKIEEIAQRMLTGNSARHNFDLDKLNQQLHAQLQGQDEVLDRLVDQLRRDTLNIFPRTTPVAWMFAGASGVGKTETAKIMAQHLTGQDPIMLNMSEYHSSAAINRIIGSPHGYVGSDSNEELPFDSLESNPHRLILLDEFEKADRAVQQLFLQTLEEGYMSTARGKKLDFSKALVIATTNAGREELSTRRMGFQSTQASAGSQSARSIAKALGASFTPELLGRFSMLVSFNELDERTYMEIMRCFYLAERERIVNEKPRLGKLLPDALTDEQVAELHDRSYVAEQGARPARRVVRQLIEDTIIDAQLAANAAFNTRPAAIAPSVDEEVATH